MNLLDDNFDEPDKLLHENSEMLNFALDTIDCDVPSSGGSLTVGTWHF